MKDLEKERREHQRLAAQALGVDVETPRTWDGESRVLGTDSDVFAFPQGDVLELNDPATGGLLFVLGASDPFGNDII